MGANGMNTNPGVTPIRPIKNNSNAYMLVYVRKDDWNKIMQTSTGDYLPKDLRKLLKVEIE